VLENISKENFNQMLGRFSTGELETLLEKFPYFQQAHLLLAKKYQQQNNPKFDQQLQLAALYTQDRELFYSIFNDKTIGVPGSTIFKPEEKELRFAEPVFEEPKQEVELVPEIEVEEEIKEELILSESEPDTHSLEVTEEKPVSLVSATETPVTEITEPIIQQPEEEFSASELHTFDEWLKAFTKTETPKIELKQEEIPVEPEKQDEELEKLYRSNIPVNLHELVQEETNYSKGLDKFIEEQIQKHKAPAVKKPVNENELDPELITETMAKVYEMQKKYAKAIRCYEVLALKYPEKNDFFAARINYLKNII